MGLHELASLSAVSSVRLLLSTTSPLQALLDKPGITHTFCNRQAINILARDGYSRCAEYLAGFSTELNAGVLWADKGWKNVNHYFQPDSCMGLWKFSTAVDEFGQYYSQSVRYMRYQEMNKAIFFLGAAAHLVQDLCVPHHARGQVFNGHKQYEEWAEKNYAAYAVQTDGIYRDGLPTKAIMLTNANTSAELFSWVKNEGDEALYRKATDILLPLAQRTTAGLFLRFYKNMCEYTHVRMATIVA